MNIQINEFYRITSQPLNIVVEKRNLRRPDEKNGSLYTNWFPAAYHGSLEQALIGLYKLMENEIESVTVSELITEIRNIKNEIISAVQRKSFDHHAHAQIIRQVAHDVGIYPDDIA